MTDGAVDATTESFQGMSLDELHKEVEDIDRGIVELVVRRTCVADTVAKVKTERDLPTTDESQGERVMECAGKNMAHFEIDSSLVKAILRLFIEVNKAEQRQNW